MNYKAKKLKVILSSIVILISLASCSSYKKFESKNSIVIKSIGSNVAKLRKEAGYSQLSLSLELGNKSPSLFSSAEVYKNKRHFNILQLPSPERNRKI